MCLWSKYENSSVGRAWPCPKRNKDHVIDNLLSMMGSRVRASFCFATPFALGSVKMFPSALAYSVSSALERQPMVVFFLFCLYYNVVFLPF